MISHEIRTRFLEFFKTRGHNIVPSDSLIPSTDPTLLFTSAGMVQFKPYFLGQKKMTPSRAASCQKCVRTTDIEQVGRTSRHLTFFEMLGNFSFGDYFKMEAVSWAWEFLTKDIKIKESQLWATVYKDDDEAYGLWKKFLPESRIVKLGDETNFWTMGPTGPCGPCSEIIYDFGESKVCGTNCGLGRCDCDRWLEVWNLVFTQFDRLSDGRLAPLPKKNIDTGMGLERLTWALGDFKTCFDSDLFKPLIITARDIMRFTADTDAELSVPLRIIADHARTVAFMINDGVIPANDGRGYVLRRLIRRAVRQAKLAGHNEPILYRMAGEVANNMRKNYPELRERLENIVSITKQEEERFIETLSGSMPKLEDLINKAKTSNYKVIPGKDIFQLFDTYGLPEDIAAETLKSQGMSYDKESFVLALNEARELARSAWKGSGAQDVSGYAVLAQKLPKSVFCGYETMETGTTICAIIQDGREVEKLSQGEEGEVILNTTPFYAESGGQAGDTGALTLTPAPLPQGEGTKGLPSPLRGKVSSDFPLPGGQEAKHSRALVEGGGEGQEGGSAEVLDTQKPVEGLIVHKSKVISGAIKTGDKVLARVDKARRQAIMRHHTATHLLHAALRKILGTHVTQAGSLVAPDRLRFDYTHTAALTPNEIELIENEVNKNILNNYTVNVMITSQPEAKKMGAMALFGEKYGDEVRCVSVSPSPLRGEGRGEGEVVSIELCGGTHVAATGEIGLFKIINETSIGSGLRRIEAYAGETSLNYLRNLEKILEDTAAKLKTNKEDIVNRAEKLLLRQKELERKVETLTLNAQMLPSPLRGEGWGEGEQGTVIDIHGIRACIKLAEDLEVKLLRSLTDELKRKIGSGLALAASKNDMKISFALSATTDAQNKFPANKLAASLAKKFNGSGGGRPDFAQGGWTNATNTWKEDIKQAFLKAAESFL